jgi:hypothetical protein
VLAALEDYARTKTAHFAHPETALVWDDLRAIAKHITGDLLASSVSGSLNGMSWGRSDAYLSRRYSPIRMDMTAQAARSARGAIFEQLPKWKSATQARF